MKITTVLSHSLAAIVLLTLSMNATIAETILRYTDHEPYGTCVLRQFKTYSSPR